MSYFMEYYMNPFAFSPVIMPNFYNFGQFDAQPWNCGNKKKEITGGESEERRIANNQQRSEIIMAKKSKIICRNTKKWVQGGKNQRKDEDFKQRQQTPQRNLPSNTLKLYLKQVKDKKSETYTNLVSIIKSAKINYTSQEFLQDLDSYFPKGQNYVVFSKVKKLCQRKESYPSNFGKVLRISIYRFFKLEIFCVLTKSVRTTRKIRNQQIKQGKIFIDQLCS